MRPLSQCDNKWDVYRDKLRVRVGPGGRAGVRDGAWELRPQASDSYVPAQILLAVLESEFSLAQLCVRTFSLNGDYGAP